MDMRGLAHFIQDIRKVTSNKDDEQKRINIELAKIRAKFKESTSLTTYDRRKYVCKLMFISMLGYPVEFGHMEGVQLLAMPGASEKLIGYLSLTVFLYEGHELMTLTTHIVTLDLLSGKDLNTSLALAAVANAGGRDFCEAMAEGVKKVILKTDNIQLRKKGLLTYLRVWRKNKEVADITEVVPVAVELIKNKQFGLVCAALTFLTGIISEMSTHPQLFSNVPAAITALLGEIILDKQTEPEYIYYGVPAPWVQAKALRLLQHFTLAQDDPVRATLLNILGKVIKATDKVVKDAQSLQKQRGTANRCNAMNCALMELTSLVVQWGLDAKMLGECTDVLNSFVNDKKDANMRYIGLLLMTRLSHVTQSNFDFAAHCRQYQQQIAVALHDPDISLRKRALLLTYSLCSNENADDVVGELLRFLPVAEAGPFKRDLVLIIVALAEKFAVDVAWYVDTVTTVISAAGEYVPEDIWHRLCFVVISTPSVQKHAVESVFQLMKGGNPTLAASTATTTISTASNASNPYDGNRCPEVVVKVASILIGEFGYQIALNSNSSPMDQVLAFQAKLGVVSNSTKAMILTALVKCYNLFDSPAVRERIVKLLTSYTGHMDTELQQRTVEYLALINKTSDAILQATLEALPPMEVEMGRIFHLLDRRGVGGAMTVGGAASAVSAGGIEGEVDIWSEKERARDQRDALASVLSGQRDVTRLPVTAAATTSSSPGDALTPPPALPPTLATPISPNPIMTTTTTTATTVGIPNTNGDPIPAASTMPGAAVNLDDIFMLEGTSTASSSASNNDSDIPNNQQLLQWFFALSTASTGVLYTDNYVSVTVNQEYRNADVRLGLEVRARSNSGGLQGLSAKLSSTSASLLVQSRDHPTSVRAGECITIDFAARSLAPYPDAPCIRLMFNALTLGPKPRAITLSLPIVTTAFCAPYRVDDQVKAETLWTNTPAGGNAPYELSWRSSTVPMDVAAVRGILETKMKMYVIAMSPNELMGIGAHAVQPASTTQFTPLLLRVNLSSQVTVRAKNPSPILQQAICEQFQRCLQAAPPATSPPSSNPSAKPFPF